MKARYIKPILGTVRVRTQHLIAFSDAIGGNKGLGYGGVDTEGTLDPSIKDRRNLWDEEW